MGSKVEYILLFLIVLLFIFITFFKPHYQVKKESVTNERVSEINNFTEYDINATNLNHILKSKKAWQIDNIWYLKEPIIKSEDIKELKSKNAIYSKNKIIFKDNVKLLRDDNTTYKSQEAIYMPNKKELITPKNFNISKNKSNIIGENLIYNAKNKETRAKKVKANIKLKESKD